MNRVLLCIILIGVLVSCKNTSDTLQEEKNKEIVISYINDVVNDHKLELIEELFSKEYVSHERNGNDVKNIKDGSLITFLEYLFKAFPDLHYTIIDIISDNNIVSINLKAQGTHLDEFLGYEASGNKVIFSEMFFFKLADNKIIEGWSIVDVEQVKNQLENNSFR